MENRQLDRATERLASYNLFSYFFLALPDEEFVRKIMSLEFEQREDQKGQRGIELIRQYILNSRLKILAAVLQELSIDRTRLLRGLTEDGPRPPYESLYLELPPADVISSLNTFYAKVDCGVSNDTHESSEQIGIELNFMRELCARELTALQEDSSRVEISVISQLQQDFLGRHLGRWAGLFAEEMLKYAQTDFYRGVGSLLKDFISEEMTNLPVAAMSS